MYEYIKSLLRFDVFNKGKNTLIQNFTKILQNGSYSEFELICKDDRIAKIIIDNDLFWSNIGLIIDKSKEEGNIINCVKSLYEFNKSYILNQKEKLFDYYPEVAIDYFIFLNKCGVDLIQIINYLNENNVVVNFNKMVSFLLTLPIGKSIIINNFDYFVLSNNRLLELKNIFIQNNINSNIDEVIDANSDIIIEEMINNKTGLSLKDLQKENLLGEMKKVLNSVLSSENKYYHDIEKIGSGGFSDVYKIGNKIIKIGKERNKFSISNYKKFLPPIYSSNIKSGIDKRQLLCIEVTDVVDTRNVNSENLYQIYKELREIGYIFVDCRLDNIGRLFKDTKVTFVDDYGNKKYEILKKGEIVILDRDHIYTEEEYRNLDKRNNEKLNNIYNYNLLKDFETRYQSEKNIQTKII